MNSACMCKFMSSNSSDIIIIETNSPNMVPCYDYYAAVVFQAEPSNVTTTIINGEIIMENREMVTVDIMEDRKAMNRIKQEVAPFARELEIKAKAAGNEAVDP